MKYEKNRNERGWPGIFAKTFAAFVIRNRAAVLFSSALFILVCGYGLKNLAITDDYHMWFDKDSSDVRDFERLETSYSKTDSVLFVIAPSDGNIFSRQTLNDISWLTREAWKLPFSTRVDSVTNFQRTEANGDDLKVHDLVVSPSTLSQNQLTEIRNFSLHEPALVKNLVSPDGKTAGVNVMISIAGKSPTETSDVAQYARNLKKQLMTRDPGVKVYLTGLLISNATDAELSVSDMQRLIPLMYFILLLSLGLMLRTVWGVIVSLFAVTLAVAATLGISGWLGYQINTISAIAPTIIMTLAISDCVHLLVTFFQEIRKGRHKSTAIYNAITYNLYPSAMTSLANAIGFASMNFNELPPFRQFGTTIAVGSLLELGFAFLFIPALLLVLPIKITPRTAKPSRKALTRFEQDMANFVLRHRFRLLIVLTAVALTFGGFASRNRLNEDWISWYSPRLEFRKDTDYAAKHLTGMYDIQYSLGTKEAGGIFKPAFLQQVEAFTEWFRVQPEVVSVGSITDDIKRVHRTMHGDSSKFYRLPSDRQLIAQYFLLYDMSLPFGMSLTNQVNRDKSSTRLMIRIKNLTTNEIIALDKRAHRWAKAKAPLLSTPDSYSSSMTLLFAQINDRLLANLLSSVGFGFLAISLLLMFLFRSVRIGIIGMVPNLVPAVITFGVWGLTSGIVGTAVAMVCSATLGIVVDSTIHFFHHYLVGRRRLRYAPEQAIHYAFGRAGTAICLTDIILMIGFSVLMLSNFAMNSVMGEMTTMIVFFDIFATLFLCVPLLLIIERKPGRPGGSMLEGLLKEGMRMKTNRSKTAGKGVALLLGGLLLGSIASASQAAETLESKGLEIARRADKKRIGYHDYSAEIKMTLKAAGGSVNAVNRLAMSVLENPGDADKELATFLEPGDVKGTSLLTYSHRSGDDDQWLYLPSLKRVKRISSSNKSGAFVGSEFSYEDMSYEAVEKYRYKFIRQEKCDVGTCAVVDQTPTYEHSGYSHLEVWYDTKESRMIQVTYYDRKNTPLKTYKASEFKLYLNRWWRPSKMEVVNAQTGNSTLVEWTNIRYHVGLASRDFDTNSLQRAR